MFTLAQCSSIQLNGSCRVLTTKFSMSLGFTFHRLLYGPLCTKLFSILTRDGGVWNAILE